MNCDTCKEQLGAYEDGELPADERARIEAHVASCAMCANELASIRALAARFSELNKPSVPSDLWDAIRYRTEGSHPSHRSGPRGLSTIRKYAIAVCAVLVVLAGGRAVSRLGQVENVASASAVDFGALLDALPTDAVGAFEKFLSQYHARSVSPMEAKRIASHLNFEIPPELPGGFRFEMSHILQFGGETGVAARYSRDGEFLGAIFHRPIQREEFGTHRDYECVVGKHRGHAVAVGEWKLVHLTDATTCHCVLSRLDETTELPPVMAKIAPNSIATVHSDGHSHEKHP